MFPIAIVLDGPIITDDVANGGVYTFNIDNTFSHTNSSDSELNFDGTYLLQDDLLILNYVKNGEDVERLLSPIFNGKEIRLSPGGDIICIEGCYFTVRKLKN